MTAEWTAAWFQLAEARRTKSVSAGRRQWFPEGTEADRTLETLLDRRFVDVRKIG